MLRGIEKEMNMFDLNQLVTLIPKAVLWVTEQEQRILMYGTPLSAAQIADAKIIPVKYPERVRLLRVNQIPLPEDPESKSAAQILKVITPDTMGLTLQYGIFIRDDFWDNRAIIVHELVHTAQYERLGGRQQFLKQYLTECIRFGYPNTPLEQEAIDKVRLICT